MGKSFFEKRPVFSIRKLSVGACSVVIGISALGLSRVHAEEKPASKVNRLRLRHQVL
ncbi:Beta-galactosidase [Streptococcus parasanguinis]|nr:YSIRK-type signal peptide-containing protein [Streptococcus parasanguinis]KXT86703.1 Beta-galactosidase [Streptococcus parasanguinis]